MSKHTSEVRHSARLGWAVVWDNDWLSAMPDEETARECAAAAALRAALEEIHNWTLAPGSRPDPAEVQKIARAAIALAKPPKE